MSGGVDSSVAAALLADAGHEVVGATLKLWGGPSDSGCCSVADVDDARRVAQQLGLAHHVFNMTEEFEASVVGPYVAAHADGRTPNPCIECNRHIKFDRLLERADPAGLRRPGHRPPRPGGRARGHRPLPAPAGGRPREGPVLRAVDAGPGRAGQGGVPGRPPDQGPGPRRRRPGAGCARRTSPTARTSASSTATEGRAGFLGRRLDLHPAEVVDQRTGETVGRVEEVELVTVGQRRGMGHGADGQRRYVVAWTCRGAGSWWGARRRPSSPGSGSTRPRSPGWPAAWPTAAGPRPR